jgi:membrane-associated phospholipid phosphatase
MGTGKIQRIMPRKALDIYLVLAICWIIGVLLLYLFPKHDIEIEGKKHVIFCGLQLSINAMTGNKFWDSFFEIITYLGDGWFALFALCTCLIAAWRLGIILTLVTLAATCTTHVLKNVVFTMHHRPLFIFNHYDLHAFSIIPNSDLHIHNSFPSGHSTQAFAICIFLALHIQNNFFRWSLVISACLVGFSRIYLGQHWTQDVIAGSCIGAFFAGMGYLISNKFQNHRFLNSNR